MSSEDWEEMGSDGKVGGGRVWDECEVLEVLVKVATPVLREEVTVFIGSEEFFSGDLCLHSEKFGFHETRQVPTAVVAVVRDDGFSGKRSSISKTRRVMKQLSTAKL